MQAAPNFHALALPAPIARTHATVRYAHAANTVPRVSWRAMEPTSCWDHMGDLARSAGLPGSGSSDRRLGGAAPGQTISWRERSEGGRLNQVPAVVKRMLVDLAPPWEPRLMPSTYSWGEGRKEALESLARVDLLPELSE